MSRGNENSKPLELEATTSTPSDKEKLFDTISESGVNFGRCNISKVLREYAEELGPGERLAVLGKLTISIICISEKTKKG